MFLNTYVAPPPIIILVPSSPIQGAVVEDPQIIECRVETVTGVSSVSVSWTGPGGASIMNNTRLSISLTTSRSDSFSIGNAFTSSLKFEYLMEGDEGTYTCNVMILETSGSQLVVIGSLTSKFSFYYSICNSVSWQECYALL